MKRKFQVLAIFLLAGCATSPKAMGEKGTNEIPIYQAQYFKGKIQRSSLDATRLYGPAFDSLVKRMVAQNKESILECVFQEGKAFLTNLKKSQQPLVFEIQDVTGDLKGKLVFSDDTLTAWSYDIEVIKPVAGKITGSLAEGNGAQINSDGKLKIRKIWNRQMLIKEEYNSISEAEYREHLKRLAPQDLNLTCQ